MDFEDLFRKMGKRNRSNNEPSESELKAVASITRAEDFLILRKIWGLSNGETLGDEIISDWRLLSCDESLNLRASFISLSKGTSFQIANQIGSYNPDPLLLYENVLPIFSTSSKTDICFVLGGPLANSVIHFDTSGGKVHLLAAELRRFWEIILGVAGVEVQKKSFEVCEIPGICKEMGEMWRSFEPNSAPAGIAVGINYFEF